MKGGLSLKLLDFGKQGIFHLHDMSFYRDINTSEALNDFLSYFLIDKLGCRFDLRPTYETIGSFYAYATRKSFPSDMHALIDCFFSHMFVWERWDGTYPIVYLVKLEKDYFIAPLFRETLSYPLEILCQLKEKDCPLLFEHLVNYSSYSSEWLFDNAWVYSLQKYLNAEKNILTLARFTLLRKTLCGIYEAFLKEFETFPCTRGEDSRQQVLNYLTSVYDFLKV